MAPKTTKRVSNTSKTVLPVVVIQVVRSSWDKSSRGGPGAVERNRMPEAFHLPALPIKARCQDYFIHTVGKYYGWVAHADGTYSEAPRAEKIVSGNDFDGFNDGCVHVRLDDGMLHADYIWTPAHGMPERHRRLDALTLRSGQWGRIRYNERHISWEDPTWSYEKWIFNIGLFDSVTPNAFLKTEHTAVYSEMDHLW